LKEISIQFSKTPALDVGKDSRFEIVCLTVRRFRITKSGRTLGNLKVDRTAGKMGKNKCHNQIRKPT
jgi:hypothetical protein